MNVDIVRNKIETIKGKNYNFRFNGNRNQVEEFNGVITNTYPAIFVIHSEEDKVRTFSYNDIITSSLEIIDMNCFKK
ncbi:MAG: hypothetical protein HFJ38_00140 [Bacilli bacterium]|nr:hypothetical protein [Bacilli bacterium]